jgi:polyhydroxyalkanoate synthesis regulator phasin
MSNIKNFLRDVGYFGIGAVASVAEVGGKAIKSLVNKGEQTLRDNQETMDELKRKTRELGDRMKATVEKATTKPITPVNAAAMTPEERAELRRQLDEADQADAQPVEADVIYHTEEPAPEVAEPEVPEVTEPEAPTPTEPPVLEVPEEDDPRDPFTRY